MKQLVYTVVSALAFMLNAQEFESVEGSRTVALAGPSTAEAVQTNRYALLERAGRIRSQWDRNVLRRIAEYRVTLDGTNHCTIFGVPLSLGDFTVLPDGGGTDWMVWIDGFAICLGELTPNRIRGPVDLKDWERMAFSSRFYADHVILARVNPDERDKAFWGDSMLAQRGQLTFLELRKTDEGDFVLQAETPKKRRVVFRGSNSDWDVSVSRTEQSLK